jgi:hypothetical protein
MAKPRDDSVGLQVSDFVHGLSNPPELDVTGPAISSTNWLLV